MKRIEDERIRFYLKHRQQIEEWAGVGEKDLPKFAHEFYTSLERGLRDQAQNCETFAGIEIKLFYNGPNWPCISLRRHGWPQGEEDPFVCLEWTHNRQHQVNFSQNQLLVCGIRAKKGDRHREALPQRHVDYPDGGIEDQWWPMRRKVDPPVGNFWEGNGLEEYGNYVVQTVLNAWRDLAPLVDESYAQTQPTEIGHPTIYGQQPSYVARRMLDRKMRAPVLRRGFCSAI